MVVTALLELPDPFFASNRRIHLMKCIFCFAELDENTEPEHILLASWGGRATTRQAVCNDCNHRFGNTIDAAFANETEIWRNQLNIVSRKGGPPPKVKSQTKDGHPINIKGGQTPEWAGKPFEIIELEDGSVEVAIYPNSDAHLEELIQHILKIPLIREKGITREQLASGADYRGVMPEVEAITAKLGTEQARRSIAKSLFVLWATKVGNDEAISKPYGLLRNTVSDEELSINDVWIGLDSRMPDLPIEIENEFGPTHNLLYVRSDAQGRVVGYFRFLNAVAFSVLLAESGGSANQAVGLISNPLDHSKWSREIADNLQLGFDWLQAPEFVVTDTQKRLAIVLLLGVRRSLSLRVSNRIAELCESAGITNEQSLNPNEATKLIEIALNDVEESLADASDRVRHQFSKLRDHLIKK